NLNFGGEFYKVENFIIPETGKFRFVGKMSSAPLQGSAYNVRARFHDQYGKVASSEFLIGNDPSNVQFTLDFIRNFNALETVTLMIYRGSTGSGYKANFTDLTIRGTI